MHVHVHIYEEWEFSLCPVPLLRWPYPLGGVLGLSCTTAVDRGEGWEGERKEGKGRGGEGRSKEVMNRQNVYTYVYRGMIPPQLSIQNSLQVCVSNQSPGRC